MISVSAAIAIALGAFCVGVLAGLGLKVTIDYVELAMYRRVARQNMKGNTQ